MIHHIAKQMQPYVHSRVWIISDLQQKNPDRTRECLGIAAEDFTSLDMPCDQIWYLGDATAGHDSASLEETTQIQLELLQPLNTPVRFILGNHDLDYVRKQVEEKPDNLDLRSHFHEAVQRTPGWNTIASIEAPYFWDTLGGYRVLFLSDHADSRGSWLTTHGKKLGDPDKYPYGEEHFASLRAQLEQSEMPVLIASHYAFPGGNRPSPMLQALMPLPEQVKAVFYGHCHIGDLRLGKEHAFRNISSVDFQKIPQINVSSLENNRGSEVKSVLLEVYRDQSIGIYFRDHESKQWAEMYTIQGN